MQRHFGHIEALDDIGVVLRYAAEVCEDQGALRLTYHSFPPFASTKAPRTVGFSHGFTQEWDALYEASNFREADPIPERTLKHGQLLTWKNAATLEPNSPEQEAFFKAMREHGLVHGFGIPLFGPRGRNAYASFDFGGALKHVSNEQLGLVRSLMQAAHQRICVLLDGSGDLPELSEREREVLRWIMLGKSHAAIAVILDISPDTVKTYSKRIYAKLDTSDRVGAVIKALQLGLVTV